MLNILWKPRAMVTNILAKVELYQNFQWKRSLSYTSIRLPAITISPGKIRQNICAVPAQGRSVLRSFATSTEPEKPATGTEDLVLTFIDKESQGKIAVLGFNRPQAKNSLSQNLVRSLEDTLEKIRFDKDVRVVIVRSLVPGIFCAGADLSPSLPPWMV